MSNNVRVELTPVSQPPNADELVRAHAAINAARLSGNVAEVSEAQAMLAAAERQPVTYVARLSPPEFEVDDFAVQHIDGRVVLNLVFEVGGLTVADGPGAADFGAMPEQADPPKPRSTWGAEGQPDPRESIPGWKPGVPA